MKAKLVRKPKLASGLVFKSKVTIQNDLVIFKLPKTFLQTLEYKNEEIYCVALDGVIQITGEHPNSIIPLSIINKKSFISH